MRRRETVIIVYTEIIVRRELLIMSQLSDDSEVAT
jgi:hypothetical protein